MFILCIIFDQLFLYVYSIVYPDLYSVIYVYILTFIVHLKYASLLCICQLIYVELEVTSVHDTFHLWWMSELRSQNDVTLMLVTGMLFSLIRLTVVSN